MNLFVAGWDLSPGSRARTLAAVRSMPEAFPLLDAATVGEACVGRGFVSWIHWPVHALGPRRYVHRGDDEVVVYDGVAADADQRVAAHDAAAWAAHWDGLGECLEGHFLAVRLSRDGGALEILNDPLGLHPAFAHQANGSWWVSNSVSLLARAVGAGTLDLEGVAGLLLRHQPGGERTLVEGISAFAPAQRWRWHDRAEPQRESYAPIANLAVQPKRSFGRREAGELAASMGGQLRALSEAFAPLMCPITAGRDTRMITAVMLAEKLPGDYFTAGHPEAPDARHAKAIAQRFGLPHRLTGDDHDGLMARWDEVSRRSALQTDGLVTLAHARNAGSAPERLGSVGVQLYGAGGELARMTSLRERFVLGQPTVADAVAEVLRLVDRRGPLLREAALARVFAHVERRVQALREQGFAVVDLPTVFAVEEGNRRWSGAQARQIAGHKGVYMPLFCRAYVRAALTTPPIERLMERVPYALVGHLSPDLRAMPGSAPWPPQWLGGLLLVRATKRQRGRLEQAWRRVHRRKARSPGRPRERRALLDAVVPIWRERFLDRADSSLWGLVDRDGFEALTAPTASQRQRSASGSTLFQVGTAFTYEETLRSWVDWQPSR